MNNPDLYPVEIPSTEDPDFERWVRVEHARMAGFTILGQHLSRIASNLMDRRRERRERPPRRTRIEEAEIAALNPEVFISKTVDSLIERSRRLYNLDNNSMPLDLTGTLTGEKRHGSEVEILAPGSWAGPIELDDAEELFQGRFQPQGELRMGLNVRRYRPEFIHDRLGKMPTHPRAPQRQSHTAIGAKLVDMFQSQGRTREVGHELGIRVFDTSELSEHSETLIKVVRSLNRGLMHIERETPGHRVY